MMDLLCTDAALAFLTLELRAALLEKKVLQGNSEQESAQCLFIKDSVAKGQDCRHRAH